MSNYPTRIDLCDGKYTLIYDPSIGQSECLRYGEPWRQLVGDKMVLACFDEIVELRQRVKTLREALLDCDASFDQSRGKPASLDAALAATEPK